MEDGVIIAIFISMCLGVIIYLIIINMKNKNDRNKKQGD